ncbi:MAG: tetratricopeptide repeat protein, partial [Pacificimonas sp.]
FLKLAAGMLDIGLDELVQRDTARRQRRMAMLTGASLAVSMFTGGLAIYANTQRIEAVEQRQVAEANERRAERTTEFLVDTFAVANPETENARTITAFSILERGAERIETELADEPQVQVKLYGALGNIFQNLGLYPQADDMISAGQNLAPPGSEDAVRFQHAAALNAYHEGRLDEALAISNATLAQVDRRWLDAWSLLGKLRETRGLVFREKFELDASLAEYNSAVRLYEIEGAKADRDRAWAENMRGSVLALKSENVEAEKSFERALALYEQHSDANNTNYASTLNNLAFLQLNSGNAKEAARNSKFAIEIFQRVLDENHPSLATVRMMRGNALFQLNQDIAAQYMYEKALVSLQNTYPNGHYQVGFAHVYLARSLSRQKKWGRAFRHIALAKGEYDRSYKQEHANHGDLEINRAIVLYEAGQEAQAKAACQTGREILTRTIGLKDPGAAGLLAECASRGIQL